MFIVKLNGIVRHLKKHQASHASGATNDGCQTPTRLVPHAANESVPELKTLHTQLHAVCVFSTPVSHTSGAINDGCQTPTRVVPYVADEPIP